MQNRLKLLLTLVLVLFYAGGCVISMPKSLLPEGDRAGIPALAGSYADSKGQIVKVTKTDKSNTFLATPPDKKNALRLTLEPLAEGRFLLQARHPDGDSVFLTVADIEKKKAVIHTFAANLEAIQELGNKNGVTVTAEGVIVEYKSAQGVIDFFNGLVTLPNHETVIFVKR